MFAVCLFLAFVLSKCKNWRYRRHIQDIQKHIKDTVGDELGGNCYFINESEHDKTNKIICAPSENSDQPGHPPRLESSLSA